MIMEYYAGPNGTVAILIYDHLFILAIIVIDEICICVP